MIININKKSKSKSYSKIQNKRTYLKRIVYSNIKTEQYISKKVQF